MDDEPTQASIEREHPLWRAWRGTDRLCHARRTQGAALVAWGEDWDDLRRDIMRAEAHLDEARPPAWRGLA